MLHFMQLEAMVEVGVLAVTYFFKKYCFGVIYQYWRFLNRKQTIDRLVYCKSSKTNVHMWKYNFSMRKRQENLKFCKM